MNARLRILLPLMSGVALLSLPAAAADYTITAIKALTGPLAFVGVPEANAIKQAVEELNAKNFLGEGNTLKLNIYDDANDRGQLLSLTNRASNDDSLIVLGTANSALAMGIAPALNELKIPTIATAQTAQPITVSPWYVKITPSPQGAVTPIANYVADKLKPKRLVLIYCRDNDGHLNNVKTFRDVLADKGTKPVLEETILMTETDFSAIATKIAGLDPDGIWLGANAAQAANIVIQLKQAGVSPDVAIFGTSGTGSVDYINVGGDAINNTYISVDYNHASTDPLNVNFIEGYKKRYNVEPEVFAAIGYSETLIAAQAIKDALPNPTREKVLENIHKLKDFPVLIGEGKWSLGPDRIPNYNSPVMVIRDRKLSLAP